MAEIIILIEIIEGQLAVCKIKKHCDIFEVLTNPLRLTIVYPMSMLGKVKST
jgi:hypothetical protein